MYYNSLDGIRSNPVEYSKVKKYSHSYYNKVLSTNQNVLYASVGLGIMAAEDEKDYTSAREIFSKCREANMSLNDDICCNLANVTEYDTIVIDVYITEAETSTAASYIKGLVIPPSTAVKLITNGEKLILTQNTGIKIVSNTADSLDVVLSYVEIS